MCFDPAFILPKVVGLIILSLPICYSFRKLWMYKYADIVMGNVVDIVDNPDSSMQNKIATIEFSYHGQVVVIDHFFTGSRNDFSKQVKVYVNKKNIKRSIVKLHSRAMFIFSFLIPIILSALIVISFFRIKEC